MVVNACNPSNPEAEAGKQQKPAWATKEVWLVERRGRKRRGEKKGGK